MEPQVFKPCEKHPERYCNCNGFYPACREAPASAAPEIQALLRAAWEHGRNSWCPASILADKERTERDWQKACADLFKATS